VMMMMMKKIKSLCQTTPTEVLSNSKTFQIRKNARVDHSPSHPSFPHLNTNRLSP
jgi:hypothetical protein